jgi:hypothetical protein
MGVNIVNAHIRNGSVYTHTARFDGSARALTEDEIFKLAPSVFATEAHESRSERYRPIPTIEVVRALVKEGFSPVGVVQSKPRDLTRDAFTKHLLRFRRLDEAKALTAADSVLEILMKNANDGTACWDLMAGMWRILCENSLVAQTSTLDSVKVRHTGDVQHKVIEGTYSVLESAKGLLSAPVDWSAINANRDDRMAFAQAAHALRFADEETPIAKAVTPERLLEPRRKEDTQPNLWTTFNVLQENVVKGGIKALTHYERDGQEIARKATTRPVRGIDGMVGLNKGLWVLAQYFADQKKAA